MSLVIDANMITFAKKLGISTGRMAEEYGDKTIDEIIKAEAQQGNSRAVTVSEEIFDSPQKLIDVFQLNNVENKFALLNSMDERIRKEVLKILDPEDLVMGLYFYTKDELLAMMEEVEIPELVNVIMEAYSLEEVVKMYTEEDLAQFFQHKELKRADIMKEMKSMPPEVTMSFVEGITGMPFVEVDLLEFYSSIDSLPEDKFRDFMSVIDPDVQRQLSYQLMKEKPEYMQLFENDTYVKMLEKKMKDDMVPAMIGLNIETLIEMNSKLPGEYISVVGAQADTKNFVRFLMEHKDILKSAKMF